MGILIRNSSHKIVILVCTTLSLLLTPAHAEESLQLYEQKIKAGLVYNFLKYTTWPEESNARDKGKLLICLYGNDPFDGFLSPLEGRTAQQSLIVIAHIAQVSETEKCNVIVIGQNEESSLPGLLQFLKNKHILTVSDIRNFARAGGMVEMSKEDEKINLYINKQALAQAGLGIEDRMLRLAKMVSG